MYCSNCGNQLSDDAKFCAACGAPTGAGEQPTAAPFTPPANAGAQQQNAAPNAQGTAPTYQQPVYQQPAYQQAPSAQTEPWYGKTWVIILFLIFFWPVGIVFMWMKTCKWQTYAKIIVTIALALLTIWQIGSIFAALEALRYYY